MNEAVLRFLQDVKKILDQGGPFYDTDVREVVFHAIDEGFIKRRPGYVLPQSFEMLSDEGDALVRDAMERFLVAANAEAERRGCFDPGGRLLLLREAQVPPPEQGGYEYNLFKDF